MLLRPLLVGLNFRKEIPVGRLFHEPVFNQGLESGTAVTYNAGRSFFHFAQKRFEGLLISLFLLSLFCKSRYDGNDYDKAGLI